MSRKAENGSSEYALRHAENARDWTAPRKGGYSAVVPDGTRFVRSDPPRAKGAASSAKSTR